MSEKNENSRSKQQSNKALLGLRDLVLNGGVEPGERLSEVALAQKLDVSRTPLRTALQKLELEGLVELIPSGGYAVRRFTLQDVMDSIELRGVLEGTAARLAAERGAESERLTTLRAIVGDLEKILADGAEALNFEAYEEKNEVFHETLAELSGSEIIKREIARVTSLPFASPSAFIDRQVDVPEFRKSLSLGQAQHKAILSAIENREGARAEALAREHARLARQNLEYVLQNGATLKMQLASLTLLSVEPRTD
ncbi:GntR family transcriptional regulator [Rhizobium sp. L1K21]|uniref:GntR family transcriptional regulator n=1 Tax=Rhizobium sp. L1K21 TaxID=2954933 RepID=UPI002092A567|nr:GntR family transcriptional regulator [Rhizobium sp. L1K21]MCO6187464.1 GntR family transcriptional regulator [Rhizobium sp. L1K21]